MRTICATIDGTLAIEFGQKSRPGGFLNEAGDIISDIALFFPLAFVPPFSVVRIVFLIALIVLSEVAGIIGPLLGSDRRLEGPLGKSDRSIVLALIGWVTVVYGKLPEGAWLLVPVLCLALVATIWNRLRFALADPHRSTGGKISTYRVIGAPAFAIKSKLSGIV
ncbi:CDP-alcohol phosphatidyltransferase family protein [Edaphobacter modestus]|nr:CDP-alcohol phosphatidyltransferase family protein [Edaphobacter modestus]